MTHLLAETHWDAIVIGTGIGGGTAGRALAEAGKKVLFLEKGPAGYRSERQGLDDGVFLPEARLTRGLWPEQVHLRLNGRDSAFFAPLGAGVGGSSVFYAGTLERPERHDLEHSADRPHPTGGWPIDYDTMRPWFDAATRSYDLCGTQDPLSDEAPVPLRDPLPESPGDAALMQAFRDKGLHPYHLHSAIRHVDGCLDCLGVKCPKPCKMDGRSAGVEPALATGNAALLDRAEVARFVGTGNRIDGVEVRHGGATHVLRADRYVLAGGALNSPRLLLASANDAWPDGCANSNGLVGRNLMFHLNEMVAIFPPKGTPASGPSKSVALRDLYYVDGQRMGTVQAMGIDVSYGEIVFYLNNMLERSALRRFGFLRQMTRIPAAIAVRLFGKAKIFVGLMEDLPYRENRVVLDPSHPTAIKLEYSFHPELLSRRKAFRRAMKRAFRGQRHAFLGMQPELNFGHPCGTLKFGSDPAKSVLNANCRAHDIVNLWVVDSSFMPTSMGVNPSLTIAANALRVADAMTREPAP
ncbi:GMC family oxidoreductase [Mesobacterium sp. TK19101]|uniref:GMC family oxidoreductase n=1 Tax=Mesobacterium hydrothermale TaxID=3111907 RepID=A0ABU6HFT2_9RHOB|nr:GMC family oxidoreductase [Mesobacterium sp. TK19101]MEC3861313.1 GMC family oxidoreductase [Mesobacterium sp. TK19101]